MEEKHGAQRDQPRAEVTDVTAAIASRSSHPATGASHEPRVHMIRLTEEREIPPYTWVNPDDHDQR